MTVVLKTEDVYRETLSLSRSEPLTSYAETAKDMKMM